MGVSTDRHRVRSAGRRARQSIVGDQRRTAEQSLVQHLRSLQASHAASVGVFIAHDGEPNLMAFIDWVWGRGCTVALPVLDDDPEDFTMRFVPWIRGEALTSGRYGISVPAPVDAIVPETLLVSLTGFDSAGNRMGRGAGFFDRYLEETPCNVVGVGFENQRFASIPTEPHDQPLPIIATDLGVRFIQK